MPCNPGKCRYAERRRCEDAPGNGDNCTFEFDYFMYYLDGYHRQFERARSVLGEQSYLKKLRELAFLEVRLLRLTFRENWLFLHLGEALNDHGFYRKEVDLIDKYHTTVRNRWAEIVTDLQNASLDPKAGWPDIFRVEAIKHWIHGVGPACDVKTREVSFDRVTFPQTGHSSGAS